MDAPARGINNFHYQALIKEYPEPPIGRLLDDADLSELASEMAELVLEDEVSSQIPREERSRELLQTAVEKEGNRSHKGGVWRVRPLTNEKLISVSYDGVAKVWTPKEKNKPQVLLNPSGRSNRKECLSAAQLTDGTIVTGIANGTMNFYDGTAYTQMGYINEPKASSQGFYSMTVLGNDFLVTGACQKPKSVKRYWNHNLKLWDLRDRAHLASKKPICCLNGHQGGISGLVTIDERQIASSSADKTLGIWDIKQEGLVHVFEGHTDYVYSIAKCNQNLLVSGSRDRTARLWDIRIKSQCGDLQMPKSLETHSSTVYDVAACGEFSILTASRDTYVKLWDRRAPGRPVKILDTDDAFAYSTCWVANDLIASGTADKASKGKGSGNVRLWELKG